MGFFDNLKKQKGIRGNNDPGAWRREYDKEADAYLDGCFDGVEED